MRKIVAILIPAVIVFAYAVFIGCPLYRLIGIRCPFCGMTRAHLALFTEGIDAALREHGLFFLGVPTLSCFVWAGIAKNRKVKRIIGGLALFLFTLLFIHTFH